MTASRKVATAYTVIVGLAVAWAWYVDVSLMHSPREHLLPDIALSMVSFPASLSVGFMYDAWPATFSRPFAQLAWLTLCGVGQAVVLFVAAGLAGAKRGEA
jgi:hypothetical protein